MGSSQATRGFKLIVAHINGNNLPGAKDSRHLENIGPDASHPDYGHSIARLHPGLIFHRPVGSHHGAAQNTGIRQGDIGRGREDIRCRDHGIFCQAAHTVHRQDRAIGTF